MDIESLILANSNTTQEISKVNQTITNITSGIKSIVNTGSQLVFTLSDNSTLTVTITGLSDNNYTTTEKNKLALLNSNILNLFTYINGDLFFNGNKVENNKLDLSNYYTQSQVNNLLSGKANSTHNHSITDIISLSTELSNRYTKLETLSKTEIQDLVNSVAKGINWKDSVSMLSDLPLTGNTKTDTRIVIETSHMYVWNGSSWVDLGGSDNLPLASSILDGKMSKEDKSKLDSIIVENLVTVSQLNDALALKADKGTLVDLSAIEGDIIPSTNGMQNIGSPTNRFNAIYVNDAKLSTNTLYLGDTPVMGTNEDTIVIKGDKDQSITMKTTGIGTTNLISEGNVTLSTSGMNANVNVQATGQGANANLSATNQVNINAPNVNIQGSIDMTGGVSIDSLTVRGNFVMNGSRFVTDATTVQVADNIIELNKNEVGYGVTAGRAGIKIDRGDADAMLLVFDESDDMFKVGTDSTLQNIASQNYVDSKDALKANVGHNHSISDISGLQSSLDSKVLNTTTINNKPLNSNITLSKSDIGLNNVQNIDTTNASNITSGILPSAQLPIATNTAIGGVKAGTNINISADGTISSTATGSNNINDSLTTSTTNTYSIDKIITLLSNKQNKLYLQNTQPSNPIINDVWINNTISPYTMNIYNGTSFVQVGSSSNSVGITDWASNTNYTINTSFVLYNNLIYRCNTTHTSGTIFTSSNWTYIGGNDAKTINGIIVDDSNRSNGKVLSYNATTGKNEWASVNVTGIVGSSQLSQIANSVSIASGAEVTFSHPSITDDKLMVNIQENFVGNSTTDTHVDFSDYNKYNLQSNDKILIGSNKTQLNIYNKLLMHMNDSTFKDEYGHTVTNTGVTYNTSNYKFGTGSAYFNGSSYLSVANSSDFNLGNSDFTIDFYLYVTNNTTSQYLVTYCSGGTQSTSSFIVLLNASKNIVVATYSGNSEYDATNTTTILTNTWYHIAITRNSSNLYVSVNGNLGTPTNIGTMSLNSLGANLIIGKYYNSSNYISNGYIDDLRIVKGVSVWNSNFTVPVAEHSMYAINTPLYIKTTNLSDFPLTTIDTITSLSIPVNNPTNTSIKCLFSVDNFTNYLYFDGTSIKKFVGDITQDWSNTSSSISQIQTLFTNLSILNLNSMLSSLGIVAVNLDLIFQLNTSDIAVTPSISTISMIYTTGGHTEFASFGSYDETGVKFGVKRLSCTQLSIKNLTTKTRFINVNTLIGS